jgi:hypothetical protein
MAIPAIFAKFAHYLRKFGKTSLIFLKKDVCKFGKFGETHDLTVFKLGRFRYKKDIFYCKQQSSLPLPNLCVNGHCLKMYQKKFSCKICILLITIKSNVLLHFDWEMIMWSNFMRSKFNFFRRSNF